MCVWTGGASVDEWLLRRRRRTAGKILHCDGPGNNTLACDGAKWNHAAQRADLGGVFFSFLYVCVSVCKLCYARAEKPLRRLHLGAALQDMELIR